MREENRLITLTIIHSSFWRFICIHHSINSKFFNKLMGIMDHTGSSPAQALSHGDRDDGTGVHSKKLIPAFQTSSIILSSARCTTMERTTIVLCLAESGAAVTMDVLGAMSEAHCRDISGRLTDAKSSKRLCRNSVPE